MPGCFEVTNARPIWQEDTTLVHLVELRDVEPYNETAAAYLAEESMRRPPENMEPFWPPRAPADVVFPWDGGEPKV